ncbi:MAG TPA: DUF5624 domain-containing protein [Trebonia sp.]
MLDYQDPELLRLFTTYTAAPDSLTVKLTSAVAARGRYDPLIVATRSDIALYAADGRPPTVEGTRMSTRGFKELAGISHVGPAVATLVQLRSMGRGWQTDARRLLTRLEAALATNSVELWRDRIRVPAYAGREAAIAGLIDYTLAATARYLRAALDNPSYLCAETLRDDFLEGGEVPVNQVMVATFFLVGLDITHRFITWFEKLQFDWDRVMVLIAGQHGRVTSGVTWNTNSIATLLHGASAGRLRMDRMYIAPHAPTFPTPVDGDLAEVIALEKPLRDIWYQTRASIELGETMFAGYPRFASGQALAPDLDEGLTEVTEMPLVHSPRDMRALVTRMRVVLEDPRQMVSSSVIDYAVEQLVATGNDPARVVVPGLDGVAYPPSAAAS